MQISSSVPLSGALSATAIAKRPATVTYTAVAQSAIQPDLLSGQSDTSRAIRAKTETEEQVIGQLQAPPVIHDRRLVPPVPRHPRRHVPYSSKRRKSEKSKPLDILA